MIILTHFPATGGSGVGVGTTNSDTKQSFNFNNVLTLNNNSDDPGDTYEVVSASVEDQFSLGTEPLPQQDGMQLYIPRKARKLIHIDGIIHAPTLSKLEYKAMQLNRYFDPINAFWDDTSSDLSEDKGFLPLYFSIPTTDTTNYATGVIAVKAYVRAVQRAVRQWTKASGYNARFSLVLEMIDPRFYNQTANTPSLTNNDYVDHASVTEYPTFPTISLTLSAAGAVTTITRNTPTDENGDTMAVRLTLTSTLGGSAAGNGDVVVLNMKTGKVTLNGNERPDFLTAGYMSFFPILPGTNRVALASTGTFSAAVMSYNKAYT